MANEKCDTCRLRYVCEEQSEFMCKNRNYCDYSPELLAKSEKSANTNEKRLIDANALIAALEKIAKKDRVDFFCLNEITQEIFDAPTVNAVEVVHTHWEDGCAIHNGKEVYKSIDCSYCEEVFKIESHDREYWKSRFKACPFCGALMDEEVVYNTIERMEIVARKCPV